MFAGRGISPDARFLGEMTISMLQGERRLRKEFDKLVDWTKDEPSLTSSICRTRC